MSFLNSAAPVAAGTTPTARGSGVGGTRRSAEAGRVRSSGGGFSTLLDDLSQSDRVRTRPERASAPGPVRSPRLAGSADAREVRLAGRPAKPAAASSAVAATPSAVAQPFVVEAPTKESGGPASIEVGEPAPEPADGLVALEAPTVPVVPDAGTPVTEGLPVEMDDVAPAARPDAVLDTPGAASAVAGALPAHVLQHDDASAVVVTAADAQGGDARASSDVDGAALGRPPRAEHAGPSNAGARSSRPSIDPPIGPEAATRSEPSPGVAEGAASENGPYQGPVPAVVSSGAVVSEVPVTHERAAGVRLVADTAMEPRLVDAGVSTDPQTPMAADPGLGSAHDWSTQDGQANASRDDGGGGDHDPTGGERPPEGMTAQASTFLVRSDMDLAAPGPGSTDASDAPARALDSQLVQAMRVQWRGGIGEATITLRPEYLGQVRVSLRLEGGALHAHLQVEDPKVRAWVESHAHVLKSGLAEQGLDLARLIVSDQPSGGGRRDEATDERGRRGRASAEARRGTGGDDIPRFEVRV